MRFPYPVRGILASLPLLCLPARADMFNNKIILVGDKGAALGGAFSGLADDATATYYNPAGMTQLKNIKLNVSAQVVQFQKQQIQISEDKTIPYNSFNFSPSITSFSQRMGKWAYGFSIVTPQNDLFRGEQSLEADYRDTSSTRPCYDPSQTPCYTKLNLSYSDVSKVTMIGPSGAMKFSDDISLGATLYGIYYTQLERTSYGGYDANYVDGDAGDLSRFHESLVVRSVSQTGLGVTASFGILVRMEQGFSFGVNASPGSLVWIDRLEEQRVEEVANQKLVSGSDTAPTPTQVFLYNLNEEGKHQELTAPRLSLGVSWHPWKPLMLTAQTDWHMGSLYTYNGFTTPTDHPLGRSGFEFLSADPVKYEIEKKSVVNFSAGMDLRLTKEYSAAFGGYTDFSQGPYDERPSSWNRRIDYYGATFSLGIEKEYTESRFGIGAAYGDAAITHFQWVTEPGGQPVLATDPQGRVERTRVDFKSYNVGLFLSSTLKI
jgi:long-subunit fatty acid transport protein